jgi:hypothetical protein
MCRGVRRRPELLSRDLLLLLIAVKSKPHRSWWGRSGGSPFSPLDEHPHTPGATDLWRPSGWNSSCSRQRSLPAWKTLTRSTPDTSSLSQTTDERGSQQGRADERALHARSPGILNRRSRDRHEVEAIRERKRRRHCRPEQGERAIGHPARARCVARDERGQRARLHGAVTRTPFTPYITRSPEGENCAPFAR